MTGPELRTEPRLRHRRTVVDHDVAIPAFDGVQLATDIHRPETDRPVGCLLQRVPYGKDVPAIVNGALDIDRAIARGYAVAIQDCRGRGRSGGTFEPFVSEADDGEATVRWLADQSWCNGRVAMFGRSYGAITQWSVAGRDVPGLRAIAPMFSGSDPVRDWLCPDGAVEWGFVLLWCIRYLAPEQLGRVDGDPPMSGDQLADLVARIEEVFGDAADDPSVAAVGELVPLLRHAIGPDRRSGAAGSPDGSTGGLRIGEPTTPSRVPTLVVGGWFDIFLGGALESYADLVASGVPAELVVGPWAHGGSCPGVFPERDFGPTASAAAVGLGDLQLDWFDRWMGEDDSEGRDGDGAPISAVRPAARVFVTGRDRWVDESEWPPADVDHEIWNLRPAADETTRSGRWPDASLGREPVAAPAEWELTWDEDDPVPTVGGQTFLPGLDVAANAGPRRQDALLGRSDVVAALGPAVVDGEGFDVLGPVSLVLAVDGAPVGLRWCARLVDVGPDGWMLVAEAAAVVSDPTAPVTVHLRGVAHRWTPGHRVGLLLSHTSFPRFSRRADEGGHLDRRGTTRILSRPEAASFVDLAVRRRRASSGPPHPSPPEVQP